MTIAVIVTMWVSLALFGAGVLTVEQVNLLKGKWYDKIEITVFLCTETSVGGTCETGASTTQAQKDQIRNTLEKNPEVQQVYYESQKEIYDQFREIYKDSPLLDAVTEEQMQDTFRIKLVDPENYAGVVAEAKGLQGVQSVQDLHAVLDPLFNWLNALKWGTLMMSGLLLLAAALQISNTIRMAAYTRRRELGIMQLVGASRTYILLPFLLESLVAALAGAALAAVTLATGVYTIIIRNAKVSLQDLSWIGWRLDRSWLLGNGTLWCGACVRSRSRLPWLSPDCRARRRTR
ncbi:MAG: cell division protein [Propionibacteriales bacterium]|nr:MAG: cell division protein [Propionibacteriales bacterium]